MSNNLAGRQVKEIIDIPGFGLLVRTGHEHNIGNANAGIDDRFFVKLNSDPKKGFQELSPECAGSTRAGETVKLKLGTTPIELERKPGQGGEITINGRDLHFSQENVSREGRPGFEEKLAQILGGIPASKVPEIKGHLSLDNPTLKRTDPFTVCKM